ncbi:MAG: sugar phosphate nucleotidyltransferase [Cuniculiplasma sp.]
MALKGVLMAGGRGTRLRPISYAIPKPLVPIAGIPCMEYPIRSFAQAGIDDIIVTTGYKFESLISGLIKLKHLTQSILFSVEKEPAGTAGSVKMVEGFLNDTFVVASGDVLADFPLDEAIESHRKSGKMATILLTEVDDPTQFGIVEDENNLVKRFLEKPTAAEVFTNTVNAGIYILEPEILKYIPQNQSYDFAKELFPKLLREGVEINTYHGKGAWLDTGRPKELIAANRLMSAKYGTEINEANFKGKMIVKEIPTGSKFSVTGNCYIGEGVRIGENAVIENSTIYDNSSISDDCRVMDSIIFENCIIGKKSKVTKSVIMKSTSIGKDCEVVESALSSNINIQDGSRIYNVFLSSESNNNLD